MINKIAERLFTKIETILPSFVGSFSSVLQQIASLFARPSLYKGVVDTVRESNQSLYLKKIIMQYKGDEDSLVSQLRIIAGYYVSVYVHCLGLIHSS